MIGTAVRQNETAFASALMQDLFLGYNHHSARKRACRVTANSNRANPFASNLLNRNFHVDAPNSAWIGDIAYIPTGEGWLYLAIAPLFASHVITFLNSGQSFNSARIEPGKHDSCGLCFELPADFSVFRIMSGYPYAHLLPEAFPFRTRLVQSLAAHDSPSAS